MRLDHRQQLGHCLGVRAARGGHGHDGPEVQGVSLSRDGPYLPPAGPDDFPGFGDLAVFDPVKPERALVGAAFGFAEAVFAAAFAVGLPVLGEDPVREGGGAFFAAVRLASWARAWLTWSVATASSRIG